MNIAKLSSLKQSTSAGPLCKLVVMDGDTSTVHGSIYLNTLGPIFGFCVQQVRGDTAYFQLEPGSSDSLTFAVKGTLTNNNVSSIIYNGHNYNEVSYTYSAGYSYTPDAYAKGFYVGPKDGDFTHLEIITGSPINSCFNGCAELESIIIRDTASVNLDFVNLKNNSNLKYFQMLGESNTINKLLAFNYSLDKLCVIFNAHDCIIINEAISNTNPYINALGTQTRPVTCFCLNYLKSDFSSSEKSTASNNNFTLINVK